MAGEIKLWYESKTLWVNVIAIVGGWMAKKMGYDLSPEMALSALGAINAILRFITKKPVVWEK